MRNNFSPLFWSSLLIALGFYLALGGPAALVAAEPAPESRFQLPAHIRAQAAPTDVKPERIEQLIAQLGDPQFEARQDAQNELAEMGFAAYEALRAARNHEDPEIAARARYLLHQMRADLTNVNDPPEVTSLLKDFRFLNEQTQVDRLEQLAALPDGQGISALCRIIRFEPSVVLAKQAAVAIIEKYPSDKVPMERLAKLLRENLKNSQRLPSRWMLGYAKFHDAPHAAWINWETWINQEQELLLRDDQNTDRKIVVTLVMQQVEWVVKMGGKPEQMADKIMTVFNLHRQNGKNARALIEWLVKQKAWEVLGQTPSAFAERLVSDPSSQVYHLAQKYLELDKKDLAEAAAKQAYEYEPLMTTNQRQQRLQMAMQLQQEGLFRWAEREFRHVMKSGDLSDYGVYDAFVTLATMLHDQGDDLRASEVIGELIERDKKSEKPTVVRSLVKKMTATMNYYSACHYKSIGDIEKQRICLNAGRMFDPKDISLLIECYHLPDADDEYRETIRKAIKDTAMGLRSRILLNSDPYLCNELAWLVACTEGNFDEAIHLARKAVEREPDFGAHYDTLARAYFAKGDLDNAVKYQVRAVELDPHSGLIAKQLEEISKAYEKKTGKPAPKPNFKKKATSAKSPLMNLQESSVEIDTQLLLAP